MCSGTRTMHRSLATRLLHWLVAAAVLTQLIGVGFAQRPCGGAPGNWFFDLHRSVGLGALGILAGFWLWTTVRRGEHRIFALLPWFSAARRRAVANDLRAHAAALWAWRLPPPGPETPLASAIHGAGLVIATAMAATGAAVWLGLAADGTMTAWARTALGLHSFVSNAMWAYLIGHAAVALAHEVRGHGVIRRMLTSRT